MTRYVVVCDAFRSRPFKDEASALRWLLATKEAGHCRLEHRVEEVGDVEST